MYSQAEGHLANLDHCGNRELRRAYLILVIAAERAGYRARGQMKGDVHELQIRDDRDQQPYAAVVNQGSLLFYLRRPALIEQPELASMANIRFGDRVLGDSNSQSELRIRIAGENDAEDIAEWLFPDISRGYAARRSA